LTRTGLSTRRRHPLHRIIKHHNIEDVNAGEIEFESDEDNNDLMVDDDVDRPGDLARNEGILAEAGAVFEEEDGHDTVAGDGTMERRTAAGMGARANRECPSSTSLLRPRV